MGTFLRITALVLLLGGLLYGGFLLIKFGLRRVPDRMVGIVYRRFGRRDPREPSRVRLYGSVGPQAAILLPNTWRWVPPGLFTVKYVSQIYVPDGTIGVVEAMDGRVRPQNRRLGQYIECDYFQNGEAFLRNGGEQGRQLGYLPGGAYYSINTELFNVSTMYSLARQPRHDLAASELREIPIPEGYVGVVIAMDGAPPSSDPDVVGRVIEGHFNFRLPWVFLGGGGQRGVQEEILPGGSRYAIHPWFARVVQIPTLDLVLEWTRRDLKDVGNFDSALDQIVLDIQGYRLILEVSQVLRIPAGAAPRLVRRFGEGELELSGTSGYPVLKPAPVRRFVERVLGATVTAYFTAIVAEYGVQQFLHEYDEVRIHLEDRIRQALQDWNVVAGRTMLGEFTSSDPELNNLRRRIARLELSLDPWTGSVHCVQTVAKKCDESAL